MKNIYHVLCIQSPNCSKFKLTKIGFHYPPITKKSNDHNHKIYTATYILKGINHEILPSPVPLHLQYPIYSNYVTVKNNSNTIKIINNYTPKSIHPDGLAWLKSLEKDN